MRDEVKRLWPELNWIENDKLREQVTETWIKALETGSLTPGDLEEIPFTLAVPDCPATFMEHKHCVVHIARQAAEAMRTHLGRTMKIDMDTVVAGAILADVGKLLEYERVDGRTQRSEMGKSIRHPFSGVALAMSCGVPHAVCHVVATHSREGDSIQRSAEAYIVHHADFMSFLPFTNTTKY